MTEIIYAPDDGKITWLLSPPKTQVLAQQEIIGFDSSLYGKKVIKAKTPGICLYYADPNDEVKCGEVIARIFDKI